MTKRRFLLLACLLAWFGRDGARGQEQPKPTSTSMLISICAPTDYWGVGKDGKATCIPSNPLTMAFDPDKNEIVFKLGSEEIRATPKQVFEGLKWMLALPNSPKVKYIDGTVHPLIPSGGSTGSVTADPKDYEVIK